MDHVYYEMAAMLDTHSLPADMYALEALLLRANGAVLQEFILVLFLFFRLDAGYLARDWVGKA